MDPKNSTDIDRPGSVANDTSLIPNGRVSRAASESMHQGEDDNLTHTVEAPGQNLDLSNDWDQFQAIPKKFGQKAVLSKKGVKHRVAAFEVPIER